MLCSCCQMELAVVLLAPVFPLQGFSDITNSCANRNESVVFHACNKRRIHSFGVCLATFEDRLRTLNKLRSLHFTHLWLHKMIRKQIKFISKLFPTLHCC